MSLPVRLPPSFHAKLWGSTEPGPWFPATGGKLGEVWFQAEPPLPILIKFLFTSESLSVQVHPPDRPGVPGKTEMWHVLRAAPGATLGLGFREPVGRDKLLESALSGEILNLMQWFPVSAGETYLVPAGTVHAIGPGVALCEIQQNSDVTYRLYDYGRDRELHLSEALEVSEPVPHQGRCLPVVTGPGRSLLAHCPYFATELLDLTGATHYRPDPEGFALLTAIEGCGALGNQAFRAGEVWLVPAGGEAFEVRPEGRARLLRSWVPAR
jgi:mannose-6-phosphate isomerase